MYQEKALHMTFDEYHTMLISKGYNRIGSGKFSRVYATLSGNHVIKLATKQSSGDIDRWFNYAKSVMDKKNLFFPKIKSITMYGNYKNSECYYVAVMERLKSLNQNNTTRLMTNVVQNAISSLWRTEKGICEAILQYSWGIDDEKQIYKIIGGEKQLPMFMEAIQIIKDVKNRYQAEDDINYNNIMRRGKQLVITDPLC